MEGEDQETSYKAALRKHLGVDKSGGRLSYIDLNPKLSQVKAITP